MSFRMRKNISEQSLWVSILNATLLELEMHENGNTPIFSAVPIFQLWVAPRQTKDNIFQLDCSLFWRKRMCFFRSEESSRRGRLLKIGRAYLNTSGQWMKNAPERVFQQTTPAHLG